MARWMDGCMNGWLVECMDEYRDVWKYEQILGWVDE